MTTSGTIEQISAPGVGAAPPPLLGPAARVPRGVLLAVAATLLAVALLLLFRFDPAVSRFYPRCLFHEATGLSCPGCGGLRAGHQLLHGRFRAALALNPLLTLGAPLLLAAVGAWLLEWGTGRRLRHPFRHPAWAWGVALLVIGFGVLRNLPWVSAPGLGP